MSEAGIQNYEAGAQGRDPGLPSELWSLLRTISAQIDEADQRHTGLLQELRDRLATLSAEAEDVRESVPHSAAPVYERIEFGLAELAQRIDAMDDGASAAPAALKSAANPPVSVLDDRPVPAMGFDPFDVVGDDDMDAGGWDSGDAEALTRIYEESDAALVRLSPRQEPSSPESGTAHFSESAHLSPTAEHPQSVAVPASMDGGDTAGVDRAWLDQRLSEIAMRIELSLAEMRSDFTVNHLGIRFDAFEERMGSVLGDVAMRTDVESLKLLEEQIQDLAAQFEHTERQLGRLDGIEQQLQAVIDHLSEEVTASGGPASVSGAAPDLQSLASSTAEEVAQRFAASLGSRDDDVRIDELGSLLRGMMIDRRHSDEQTYTMLDTVQQAMIRLLDRIDALEFARAVPHEHRVPAAHVSASQPSVVEIQDFGAPEHRREPQRAMGPPPVPAAPIMPGPSADDRSAAPASIDKLRQDFIADAQRAKMRAAAAAEMASEAAPALQGAAGVAARIARGLPRSVAPAAAGATQAAPASSSRKQRLTALALCLVIAVSGSALLLKSRTNPAAAIDPGAVTQTMPADAAPAATDEMVIDVPAAPAPAAAMPPQPSPAATAEGAGFEVPAEEPVAVPIPAPRADGNAGAAPAVGMPAGGEGLNKTLDSEPGAQVSPQSYAPQGIILQDGQRKPTVQELVHLQSQQNVAALSSRLGTSASQLLPADLMPEEVAKYKVTPISAMAEDQLAVEAQPASVSMAALPGQNIEMPVTIAGGKTVSQLSLPPATVGPLSLRLAAANGDPSAAFEVGARLAEGKGTSQNFQEAMIWYQKSAAQGFAQAQYRLGTLYERGLGTKADVARAQMWYQRAAEQGNVKAMHNLAVLSAGRTGSPDYITAARWFQSAADYGLSDSQYNLAVLFENGLGIAQDPVQAYKWYALAGRGGDAESVRRRDALKSQMTADQRLRGDEAVATFNPKRTAVLINDARAAGEDWKKRQDG